MAGEESFLTSVFRRGTNFAISCSSSGNNTIVTVADGNRFAVLDILIQPEADVSWQLKSGSTVLTGSIDEDISLVPSRRLTNPPYPVFTTVASGDDLILSLSGSIPVNGYIFGVIQEGRN